MTVNELICGLIISCLSTIGTVFFENIFAHVMIFKKEKKGLSYPLYYLLYLTLLLLNCLILPFGTLSQAFGLGISFSVTITLFNRIFTKGK